MHSNEDTELRNHMSADSQIKPETFPIGEVAKMIGSKVRTIRYYDEIGLVKPTSYTEAGHRLYTTDDIRRLELTATLRYYFNKYIVNQDKKTAAQIAAWNELQELLNNPQFIKDLKNIDLSFFIKELPPRYNANTWIKELDYIQGQSYELNKS